MSDFAQSKEYERLTQQIYQTLHAAEGFNTINVQHNVEIQGKSGCAHQIDVFWEFKIAGRTFRVAVECKNYNSNVSIGKIRDFFGVLHDIGNIQGIFVTKIGFQSGAKQFADYYGIDLKELRFPTAEDWKGRIKDIHLKFTAYSLYVTDRIPEFDSKWIFEKHPELKGEEIKLTVTGLTDEIYIYDEHDQTITNFHEIEKNLPHKMEEVSDLEFKHDCPGSYLVTSELGKVRINSILFRYGVSSFTQESISEGNEIALAILKDIKTNNIKFIDKMGNVKE